MSAPHFKSINLIPPSEFELSFWGRFLKWGVGSGRYILIVTEMIVIAAFLFEFKMNDDLDNLNQTLEGQKNILQSLSPAEEEFRQVQARMSAAGTMIDNKLESKSWVDRVVKTIPEEIKLESLRLTKKEITLTAKTTSHKALGVMVEQLANDKLWNDVQISDFKTDDSKIITFDLVIKK